MKLCALALIASLAFSQATLSLTGPAAAKTGAAVTLTLTLATGGGPAALQWNLAGLPTGATVTSSVASKTATCALPTAPATGGPIGCLLIPPTSALNVTAIPDGPVATIQYTQPAAAVTTAVTGTLGATPAGASLAVTQPLAALTVPVQSNCDLNGDGKTDATDVGLMIQQALSAFSTPAAQATIVQIIQEIIAANGGACLR